MMVINKPRDLVRTLRWYPDGTVLNALRTIGRLPMYRVRASGHRLDKDTTGLMVVAKTVPAQTRLVESLQLREITREYEAVAIRHTTAGGSVEEPISRHPTKRTHMAVDPMGKPANALSDYGRLPCAHASAATSGNRTYATRSACTWRISPIRWWAIRLLVMPVAERRIG
ncbi:pseudouridine synthase [Shigella flexneri]